MADKAEAVPQQVDTALEDIYKQIIGWQDTLFTHSIWYTLIVAVLAAISAFVLIKILNHVFKRRSQGNLRFFYRLINMVIIAVSVLMVMMTITPLKSMARTLLAGSGLLAVVIGIAAQASLSNVFSGIFIGISRPFVIGERIEVIGQDIVGEVTEMNLRHTVIRDLNNKSIVIPNAVLDKKIIRTLPRGQQSIINYLTIGVGYDSDIDRAIRIIKDAVLAHKDFYDTRTEQQIHDGVQKDVTVAVTELAASSVQLRASVWSKDAGTGFMMLSDLRKTILQQFKAQNIEIPYNYENIIIKQAEKD